MIVKDLSNSFHPVPKSSAKNVKNDSKNSVKNVIKKKSCKLAKLERDRDKDITKAGKCEFCGKESKHLDPHEIYGGCNRKRSIKNNFVKLLCRKCHSNEEILKILKIQTQKEFEKEHTREEFIKLIGKSFI